MRPPLAAVLSLALIPLSAPAQPVIARADTERILVTSRYPVLTRGEFDLLSDAERTELARAHAAAVLAGRDQPVAIANEAAKVRAQAVAKVAAKVPAEKRSAYSSAAQGVVGVLDETRLNAALGLGGPRATTPAPAAVPGQAPPRSRITVPNVSAEPFFEQLQSPGEWTEIQFFDESGKASQSLRCRSRECDPRQGGKGAAKLYKFTLRSSVPGQPVEWTAEDSPYSYDVAGKSAFLTAEPAKRFKAWVVPGVGPNPSARMIVRRKETAAAPGAPGANRAATPGDSQPGGGAQTGGSSGSSAEAPVIAIPGEAFYFLTKAQREAYDAAVGKAGDHSAARKKAWNEIMHNARPQDQSALKGLIGMSEPSEEDMKKVGAMLLRWGGAVKTPVPDGYSKDEKKKNDLISEVAISKEQLEKLQKTKKADYDAYVKAREGINGKNGFESDKYFPMDLRNSMKKALDALGLKEVPAAPPKTNGLPFAAEPKNMHKEFEPYMSPLELASYKARAGGLKGEELLRYNERMLELIRGRSKYDEAKITSKDAFKKLEGWQKERFCKDKGGSTGGAAPSEAPGELSNEPDAMKGVQKTDEASQEAAAKAAEKAADAAKSSNWQQDECKKFNAELAKARAGGEGSQRGGSINGKVPDLKADGTEPAPKKKTQYFTALHLTNAGKGAVLGALIGSMGGLPGAIIGAAIGAALYFILSLIKNK